MSLTAACVSGGLERGDPLGGAMPTCAGAVGVCVLSGFIPALVEKRLPLAALITIPPRSKDTVVIDGA